MRLIKAAATVSETQVTMWKAAQFVTNVGNKQFVSYSGNSLSNSVSITTKHSCKMLWDKSGQVSEWERSATSSTICPRDKNVPVDSATKHVPRLVARQWKRYATCSGTSGCAGALFTQILNYETGTFCESNLNYSHRLFCVVLRFLLFVLHYVFYCICLICVRVLSDGGVKFNIIWFLQSPVR